MFFKRRRAVKERVRGNGEGDKGEETLRQAVERVRDVEERKRNDEGMER